MMRRISKLLILLVTIVLLSGTKLSSHAASEVTAPIDLEWTNKGPIFTTTCDSRYSIYYFSTTDQVNPESYIEINYTDVYEFSPSGERDEFYTFTPKKIGSYYYVVATAPKDKNILRYSYEDFKKDSDCILTKGPAINVTQKIATPTNIKVTKKTNGKYLITWDCATNIELFYSVFVNDTYLCSDEGPQLECDTLPEVVFVQAKSVKDVHYATSDIGFMDEKSKQYYKSHFNHKYKENESTANKDADKKQENVNNTPAASNTNTQNVLPVGQEAKTESGATVQVSDNGAVTIKKTANKKSVSIGDKVVVNGVEYQVTELSSKAISGKKVKNVTINASNIKKVSSNAFKGAKNLKKLTLKGVKKGSKIAKKIEAAARKANKNVKIIYKK